MKRLIILFNLFCFISVSISAQNDFLPGYIVKNTGDTVKGFIFMGSSKENCQKCVFKANKEAKSVTYLPADLQSYHFENSLFYFSREVMVENVMKKVFLEWAVKGKLDLYLYDDPRKAMRYFVDKADSGFVELLNTKRQSTDSLGVRFLKENREYAATLAIMLQDCPTIIPVIYSSSLEAKDLIKLSAEYQNMVCPDEQCTIFKRPTAARILWVGPLVGNYSSTLHQPPFSNFPASAQALSKLHFEPTKSIYAGAFLEISNFNFLSPRFALRSELSYIQAKYEDKVLGTVYKVNRIRFAEMFKYSFSLGKFRPSIAAGPAFFFRTLGETYDKSVTIVNSYGTEQTVNLTFPTFKRGINLAGAAMLAVDYLVSDKVSVGLEGGYEYLSQFMAYTTDQSYTNDIMVQFKLGYRLK